VKTLRPTWPRLASPALTGDRALCGYQQDERGQDTASDDRRERVDADDQYIVLDDQGFQSTAGRAVAACAFADFQHHIES
jgi:hypothetical protein